ncbi:LytTR family DNA-binding domain-containing protein [Allosphingosinicella sp.]|uniref:LytTR family DNA-binding domain-containing protein n=1 Tax=Allosphingosinicella sp. TaxID=2823234 RepID=UPI003D70D54D
MERVRGYLIEITIVAAIGAVLAALGPFGSFGMGDYGTRLAYWMPGAFLGYAAFRLNYVLVVAAADKLRFPKIGGVIAAVLLGAMPASLLILWWNGARFADIYARGQWLQLYLQVAIIGALVVLLFILIERAAMGGTGSGTAAGDEPKPPYIPFLERLPPEIAADLIALEMEDHYVRAHAPGRSTLILMRMRDAEAELAPADGMRVHRSWWVARGAVEAVQRDGRRLRLRLRGGIEAPVARDRERKLREAGWRASP